MMGKVIMSGIVPPLVAPVTGILAGDLAVGSSVYLMENGVATEYLVVNHGKPSGSSLYDDSCDGLWLLRKDIIENRAWDADNSNVLETSDIHEWLNTNMFAKFDSIAQSAIKQVKIPYRSGGTGGSNQIGANGLSCKMFLLSGYEVGWTTSDDSAFPVDGAVLDYFKGTASIDSKRLAYLNGRSTHWWLRSPHTRRANIVWHVYLFDGDNAYSDPRSTYGIRPALILPSSAVFDETTMLLKGVA